MTYQSGYIKGIDGIRAVAVILVLLFHVRVDLFEGGYIGVDVFFVISGFLITRLILKEAELGQFSFRGFYARRIRRLLPALFVTCVGTFIYAAIFLGPYFLISIARSAIAAIFSVSNFIFLSEAHYFNTLGPKRPLLQTWSLGIEEQFYIIWPALLIALTRFSKKHLPIVIVVVWILSFTASIALIQKHPNIVFYMTPFRMWEFATGALLLYVPSQKGMSGKLLSLAGLISVIACAIVYDKNTLFPGLTALIPCLGAAAMIVGSESGFSLAVLDNMVAKFIGRISYSLYLIHWPIVVFWLMHFKSISDTGTFIILGLSFVASSILYFGVESRFRYKRENWDIFARPAALFAGPIFLIMILLSTNAITSGGWLWRAKKEVRSYFVEATDLRKLLRHGACFLDRTQTVNDVPEVCYKTQSKTKNLLIIGTSQAADLYPGISEEFSEWGIYQVTRIHCYPLIRINKPEFCKGFNKFIYEDLIASRKYDLIVLSGLRYNSTKQYWKETQEFLEKSGVDYVVVGPKPKYRLTPHYMVWEHNQIAGLDQYIFDRQRFTKSFESIIDAPNHYFSIENVMCEARKNCLWQINGEHLYADQTHFSKLGSIYIAEHLKDWYDRTRATPPP